jgi:hypothetical protein
MMTGLAGLAMWLMMGVMLLGVAAGGIAWMRRRLHGRPHSRPPTSAETPEAIVRHRSASGQIHHRDPQ